MSADFLIQANFLHLLQSPKPAVSLIKVLLACPLLYLCDFVHWIWSQDKGMNTNSNQIFWILLTFFIHSITFWFQGLSLLNQVICLILGQIKYAAIELIKFFCSCFPTKISDFTCLLLLFSFWLKVNICGKDWWILFNLQYLICSPKYLYFFAQVPFYRAESSLKPII